MPTLNATLDDYLLPDSETIHEFFSGDLTSEICDSSNHHLDLEDDTEWESETISKII